MSCLPPASSPRSPRRRLAGLPLLAGIALLPACGGDDGPEIPPPNLPVVDEDVLRAELEAWKGRVVKDCSLADAMPSAYRDGERPAVDRALDVAEVTRRLGPGLFAERGGELFVLDAPSPPSRSGSASRRVTSTVNGDVVDTFSLGSALAWDGTCVITYDGDEVFRGSLWGALPVAIHARVPGADGVIGSDEGRRQTYRTLGGPVAFIADDSLRVLVTGLAADLPAASAAFAASLGVAADDLADLVVSAPAWLEHVVHHGALAPAPVIEAGFGNAPLDVVAAPTFAVVGADLAGLTEPGARTAIVRLPRPGAGGVGVTSVQVGYRSELLDGGLVRSSITRVERPSYLPPVPAERAGARCVSAVADATHRYLRDLGGSSGAALVPAPVMLGNGAVQTRWVLAPCEGFALDLVAELRADEDALRDLADLLEPLLYGARSLAPDRWSRLMAAIVVDADDVDAYDRVAHYEEADAVGAALRTLFAIPRYENADAEERAALRALVWQASILCDAALTSAQVSALLSAAGDDLGAAIDAVTACPAS
jgi:hypothetical protein